jgi:hypothetical protein
VLGGGAVDGAARAAPDPHLRLVAVVAAVGVLQQRAEDAAPAWAEPAGWKGGAGPTLRIGVIP